MITFSINIAGANVLDEALQATQYIVGEIKTDNSEGNIRQSIVFLMNEKWNPIAIRFEEKTTEIILERECTYIIVRVFNF